MDRAGTDQAGGIAMLEGYGTGHGRSEGNNTSLRCSQSLSLISMVSSIRLCRSTAHPWDPRQDPGKMLHDFILAKVIITAQSTAERRPWQSTIRWLLASSVWSGWSNTALKVSKTASKELQLTPVTDWEAFTHTKALPWRSPRMQSCGCLLRQQKDFEYD